MLKENYELVDQKITEACKRAGRDRKDVTLIAVSKTKPLSDIEELLAETDAIDFGENKVQELVDKYETVSRKVNWHMIGHLQTNKVKYIVDKVCLIHSVDSLRLAVQISEEAVKKGIKNIPILMEINIAGEDTKFGFTADEAFDALKEIAALPNIMVRGLMTSAPYVTDPEDNRKYFRQLKQLCVDLKAKNIDNTSMDLLSMGMTNDYEVAVEEGATHVRVGTAIFGERDYNI